MGSEYSEEQGADWVSTNWGNLVELKYGKSLKDYKHSNGKYPVYGTNGPVGWCDKPLCGFSSVIVGRKGAYRGIHFSSKPFYVIDTAFYVVPKIDINLKWAYYSLLTQDINGMDSGSAIPSTSRDDFYALQAKVPPRYIQNAIVDHLDALNDKIELNRQINATLEAMAQALFKSWFVDFDPVIDNALAAGNPIPEPLQARAATRQALAEQRGAADAKPGLPVTLRQQFPDRFVFSDEMGWVPEGWEVVPLVEFGTIVCGKTPSKPRPEYFGHEIPFIKIPDMHTAMFVVDPTEMLSQLGANTQIKKTVPRGSVCVSCIATVGKVIIATTESQTNQQINSIVPRAQYLTPYLYFYMLNLEKHFHDLASGGAVTLNMNTSTFSKIGVLKPNEELLEIFGDSVQSQFAKIENTQFESMALARVRDTLLPKLLSGQLRIPEAEKILGEQTCR